MKPRLHAHCSRLCYRLCLLMTLFVFTLVVLLAYRRSIFFYPQNLQERVQSYWGINAKVDLKTGEESAGGSPARELSEAAVPNGAPGPAAAVNTTRPPTTPAKPPPPQPPRPQERHPPCLLSRLPVDKFRTVKLNGPPDVTVVSAFFDIGKFQKGGGRTFFMPDLYKKWAGTYKHLQNPLVVYTDSTVFRDFFLDLRKDRLSTTRVEVVNRTSVWAFDYVGQVKTILSAKNYPRYPPNTVVPEYACVQHAKYWALQDVLEKKYFNTTYVTWLDIGYFRLIVMRNRKFVIIPPPGFDENKIAVNMVSLNINFNTPVKDVFWGNAVWVGGGMIFGNKRTMPVFIKEYKIAVERYLSMNLTNTDQQVLLAMNLNSEKAILKNSVELQTYTWNVPGDCWFFLGYECYRELE